MLPAKQNGGLPVVTVNVPEVDIQFLRVKPDQLPRFLDRVIATPRAKRKPGDDDEDEEYDGRDDAIRSLSGAVSLVGTRHAQPPHRKRLHGALRHRAAREPPQRHVHSGRRHQGTGRARHLRRGDEPAQPLPLRLPDDLFLRERPWHALAPVREVRRRVREFAHRRQGGRQGRSVVAGRAGQDPGARGDRRRRPRRVRRAAESRQGRRRAQGPAGLGDRAEGAGARPVRVRHRGSAVQADATLCLLRPQSVPARREFRAFGGGARRRRASVAAAADTGGAQATRWPHAVDGVLATRSGVHGLLSPAYRNSRRRADRLLDARTASPIRPTRFPARRFASASRSSCRSA